MATESSSLDKSYFQQFCDYMKRDTKGVEIATYTISGVLFVVAYNKIRPLTRFGKPSDIPKHFIREQLPQYGRVQKIEPSIQSGPLLIVKHRPPLNLIFWSSKTLPVRVAGIDINANGYSWLQSVVVNRKVTFVPIQVNSGAGFAECSVCFQEFSADKKRLRQVDVAQALLNLGFAKLAVPAVPRTKIVSKDPFERKVQTYYRTLARSESYAKERRTGLWQQALPPKLWPVKVWQDALDGLVLRMMPKTHRLPELVR
ncbi:protein C3orf33 [Wyeomyia smithii]|uniref:protein C3orf33 n=1 Tax=Wyeomyia smithii TaxID=174621 RepID=UPI002468033B|nr:protein C3orf33 [Wyeomyia smithii]XP_055525343.1 protein C3orf33 [Wyeomyia smithii]